SRRRGTDKDLLCIVAGRGGGILKYPGIHYLSNDENASDMLLECLKSVAPEATSVGVATAILRCPWRGSWPSKPRLGANEQAWTLSHISSEFFGTSGERAGTCRCLLGENRPVIFRLWNLEPKCGV
ncbi:MAG: hypothetical protein ACPG4T_17175, partial [Nannocystaceae bacterium]